MIVDFSRAIEFCKLPVWLLAQAVVEGAPPNVPPPNKAAPDLFTAFLREPFSLVLMVLMLFFFIVLWPQQRQDRAQRRALMLALANLKKNDRVVTSAGIHGTIVQAASDSPTVTIRIDEGSGAKMTVNRESITKVLGSEAKSEKDS